MDDLKLIKKYYGEKMMHLCREFFSTLLETPGLLSDLMLKNFEPSKFLYEDLVKNEKIYEFKDYIYSLKESNKIEKTITNTPQELLSIAGYDLYECKSEEDIQSFKKYYRRGEELCTFKGNRLERCHVFFAVKKNVEEIKRENYKNPERQDEYGTSVISIQFSRGENNTLSIKNRYNHTVTNPDATFSNNLDNIIPGLTESFEKHYNLNLSNNKVSFEIPGYVKANDGKYYKYNMEINNIYYCPNNIIIDNFEVKRDYQEMERYIILDYFILDLQEKTIKLYDETMNESFQKDFINIEKIEITKDKISCDKEIKIINGKEPIIIKIDKDNNILSYDNKNITKLDDYFLQYNKKINNLIIPNVEDIGYKVLSKNTDLTELSLPKVKIIGSAFLFGNKILKKLDAPKLVKICQDVFYHNEELTDLYLPSVEIIEHCFLSNNKILKKIYIPKVKKIGDRFLDHNINIDEIKFPEVEIIGDDFLLNNEILKTIHAPNLLKIGNNFLKNNKDLININLPKCEIIKALFIYKNINLKEINIPKLKKVGRGFLGNNNQLKEINFKYLENIGDWFLLKNNSITKVELPSVKTIGEKFMEENKIISEIKIPNVIEVESNFLLKNNKLEIIKLPKCEIIGSNFLKYNNTLKIIEIPKSYSIGTAFLENNDTLEKLIMSRYPIIGFDFFENHDILIDDSSKKIKQIYDKLNIYNPNIIIKIINSITPKIKYNKIVEAKKTDNVIEEKINKLIKNLYNEKKDKKK